MVSMPPPQTTFILSPLHRFLASTTGLLSIRINGETKVK